MFDGLSVLPSNVWTMSVSLRGVPTSVSALVAAPAGFPAAAVVGPGAPLVGTSDGVGDGVQAATNPETTSSPTMSRAERTILATMDSPCTLPPRARPAAIRTQGSARQARPVAPAPRPAPSRPGGRAAGSSPAAGGCSRAPPRRHLRGTGTDPAAIRQSSQSVAA